MRFMNEYDIEDAVVTHNGHPILSPATLTLYSVMEAANSNSDGWAYWPKPARAASKLMELLEGDGTWDYRRTLPDRVTKEMVKKAYVPIKAFRTRTGIDFKIYEV